MTKRAGVIAGTFVLAIITALNGAATAQITADQQSAIRASCRSDFQSKCSGVTPGGTEALACLQKNVARLSPACKTAVSATLPEPVRAAPAAGAAGAAPPAVKPKPARAAIPETPPTVAVAPLKPRRFIMPERRILIEESSLQFTDALRRHAADRQQDDRMSGRTRVQPVAAVLRRNRPHQPVELFCLRLNRWSQRTRFTSPIGRGRPPKR